ncbi:Alpha/Beta hydrolase protein [Crucibulum laeve]|uniref:Alpha/Beta hydrolase protein n=1 Tax=Crucibulum laeve TaxID=68775 RepID=A0A5C3MHE5_9AGAR|nr:Alpha/Beta hydrolase protein [Crucibulum laeve]
MNPQDPASFNHRTEKLSTGRVYHFVDQLPDNYDPKRNVTLLCVHGFPDLWYGWRYQIGPWVRKGCRVVVPDMLGYGGTEKPMDSSEYTTKKLSADLAAILDVVGVKRAVLVGHDWGSYAVGRFALWHPERLLALVMMSVPYTPPSRDYISLPEVVKRAPNLGYQLYFASHPKSTIEILAHLKKFILTTFRPPTSSIDFTSTGSLEKLLRDSPDATENKSILTDQELNYYYDQFKKGMNGPLNYYRTSRLRHDEELAAGLPANLRPNLPVLFVWGTADATATPFVIDKSRKFISQYQDVALEGRGHWIMVEAKDEITEKVISWLESLTSSSPRGRGKL